MAEKAQKPAAGEKSRKQAKPAAKPSVKTAQKPSEEVKKQVKAKAKTQAKAKAGAAQKVTITSKGPFTICLDVGGTKVLGAIFDEKKQIVYRLKKRSTEEGNSA